MTIFGMDPEYMAQLKAQHDRNHMEQEATMAEFDSWYDSLAGDDVMHMGQLMAMISGQRTAEDGVKLAEFMRGRLYDRLGPIVEARQIARDLETVASETPIAPEDQQPKQSPDFQEKLDRFEVWIVTPDKMDDYGALTVGNVVCNNCKMVFPSLGDRIDAGPAGKDGCPGCLNRSAHG